MRSLKASSLIETVWAMASIVLLFAVAITTFRFSLSFSHIKNYELSNTLRTVQSILAIRKEIQQVHPFLWQELLIITSQEPARVSINSYDGNSNMTITLDYANGQTLFQSPKLSCRIPTEKEAQVITNTSGMAIGILLPVHFQTTAISFPMYFGQISLLGPSKEEKK